LRDVKQRAAIWRPFQTFVPESWIREGMKLTSVEPVLVGKRRWMMIKDGRSVGGRDELFTFFAALSVFGFLKILQFGVIWGYLRSFRVK
jgi:hypothetical protein